MYIPIREFDLCSKIKKIKNQQKKYHTVWTVPKSKRK